MHRRVIEWTALVALTASAIYFLLGFFYLLLPVDESLNNRVDQPAGVHFPVFYVAGRMAAEGFAADVYDVEEYNAVVVDTIGVMPTYSWSYPPVAFFWLAPLSVLPFTPALLLWTLLPVLATAWVCYRILPHRLTPTAAALSIPVVHNVVAAQNGALSAAILGGGLLLLPVRPVLAGMVFALTAYKPHLALILPLCLLAGRHFSALAAMVAGGVILAAASLWAFGMDSWLAFLAQLTNHMGYVDRGELPIERFPTFFGVANRVLDDAGAARLLQVAGSVVVAAAAMWTWRRTRRPAERTLALMTATLLATPYAFDYDLAILVVPFFWLLKDYLRAPDNRLEPVALASIWLMPLLVGYIDAAVGWLLLILLLILAMYRVNATGRTTAVDRAKPGAPDW